MNNFYPTFYFIYNSIEEKNKIAPMNWGSVLERTQSAESYTRELKMILAKIYNLGYIEKIESSPLFRNWSDKKLIEKLKQTLK